MLHKSLIVHVTQASMGVIPAKAKMPLSKFVFPLNGGTVTPNTFYYYQNGHQEFRGWRRC